MSFDPDAILPDRDVVLPDGCIDLLINTGPSFTRFDNHVGQEFQVREYALIGQRKNAIEISQTAETTFFAIRFTPFGLKSIIPIESSELTGKMLEEDKTLKSLVDSIRHILEKKNPFHEKLQRVEEAMEKRFNADFTIKPIIEKATRHILSVHGNFNVSTFCREYKIHKSTLEKYFLTYVGLRPKEFASIVRFNYAHSKLRNGKANSLTQLALECGYYDQSHMIKDFKRFSNSSPSKFIKANYLLPEIATSCHQSLVL